MGYALRVSALDTDRWEVDDRLFDLDGSSLFVPLAAIEWEEAGPVSSLGAGAVRGSRTYFVAYASQTWMNYLVQ